MAARACYTEYDWHQPEAETVTKDMLERALKSAFKRDDVEVREVCLKPATAKGENIITAVVSANVVARIGKNDEIHHLIIKVPICNEYLRYVTVCKIQVFTSELSAYNDLLPRFVEFQKERGVLPMVPPTPRYFYGDVDLERIDGVVVLEDLRQHGYQTVDKRVGLDLDHCKLAIEAIAQYHALSFAMKNGDAANLFNAYSHLKTENFYLDDLQDFSKPFYAMAVKKMVDLVRSISADETIRKAAGRLLSLDIFDMLRRLRSPVEPFSVICHGDFWCNNLMFQYERVNKTLKPVSVRMIDFQGIRYARPTDDVIRLLYTSTTPSFRKVHAQFLLKLYHETFMKTLDHVKFKCSEFTFEVFQEMYEKSRVLGIVFTLTSVPFLFGGSRFQDSCKFSSQGTDIHDEVKKHYDVMDASTTAFMKERVDGVIEEAIELGLI